MKKLIILLGLIVIGVNLMAQSTEKTMRDNGDSLTIATYDTYVYAINGDNNEFVFRPWATFAVTDATTTELDYSIGVTSAIQTQLNAKLNLADTVEIAEVAKLKHPTINAQTGASYTLVLLDDGKILTMTNAGAITLTVPTNAAVAFPIGTEIPIINLGSTLITVSGAAPPAIVSKGSNVDISALGDASLVKVATDTWKLIGSLE